MVDVVLLLSVNLAVVALLFAFIVRSERASEERYEELKRMVSAGTQAREGHPSQKNGSTQYLAKPLLSVRKELWALINSFNHFKHEAARHWQRSADSDAEVIAELKQNEAFRAFLRKALGHPEANQSAVAVRHAGVSSDSDLEFAVEEIRGEVKRSSDAVTQALLRVRSDRRSERRALAALLVNFEAVVNKAIEDRADFLAEVRRKRERRSIKRQLRANFEAAQAQHQSLNQKNS